MPLYGPQMPVHALTQPAGTAGAPPGNGHPAEPFATERLLPAGGLMCCSLSKRGSHGPKRGSHGRETLRPAFRLRHCSFPKSCKFCIHPAHSSVDPPPSYSISRWDSPSTKAGGLHTCPLVTARDRICTLLLRRANSSRG